MDRAFPFGFPFPTAFYLTLYVLTLVVHVIFMNYVLAGTGYLALAGLTRWGKRRKGVAPPDDVIFDVLRDWMPFMLGAAITAGVAPLLFLQILYKENFYTANLLLFHRWMAILPVLIVGFYLLYVLKSRWIGRQVSWLAPLVGIGALACFVFTGYAWTENHLLSLDRASWPGHYESGALFYRNPLTIARFSMWATGALPTMAVMLACQVQLGAVSKESSRHTQRGLRRIANLAMLGIVLSGLVGGLYLWLERHSKVTGQAFENFAGPLTRPYSILVVAGLIIQIVAWIDIRRRERPGIAGLVLVSIGLLACLVGASVVRESIRLSAIEISGLYEQHAQAARVGGWWVFALFLAVNAVLIGWCIRLVRNRATR